MKSKNKLVNHSILEEASIVNITVNQWFYSKRCSFKGNPVCEITSKAYISWYTNHVQNYIGNRTIYNVSAEDCNQIIQRLIDNNVSRGTVNGVYSVLTKIFRSALAEGIISESQYPCSELYGMIVNYKSYIKTA